MSQADTTAFHQALSEADAGNTRAAEPTLQKLLAKYPANDEVNEAIGLIYAEGGDFAQALPYLRRACSSAPNSAVDHANLGTALLKMGSVREAAAELSSSARLDPGNPETLSALGQAYMLLQRPADAADAFSRAAQRKLHDPDLLYNWAVALNQQGASQRALEVLDRIPKKDMSDEAESLAGEIEEQMGHFMPAVEHDQRAVAKNPDEANLYALCVEYLRHWTWNAAEKTAQWGAAKYPASVRLQLARGVAFYGAKDFPDAANVFSTLLQADPENEKYADMLARTCGEIAAVNPDCNALETLARQHPENAFAAVYAARRILERPHSGEELDGAERLLTRATAADPQMADGWYALGLLDAERREWQSSATALEKATALDPSFAPAHYQLADAYAHLHRAEERKRELDLFQTYSQQEKDQVNARVREMTVFLTKSP